MAELKQLVIETVCRRCCGVHEWSIRRIPPEEQEPEAFRRAWILFSETAQDWINNPRQNQCDTCGKATVQDVVAYTDILTLDIQ